MAVVILRGLFFGSNGKRLPENIELRKIILQE